MVRAQAPDLDEAEFVDNVSRQLRRGEFLLLIVGDGIREGVENIVHFVQSHSGLHFNLALVEAALYRDTDARIIIQPRVLTRTEVVRRVVVEGGLVEDLASGDADDHAEPSDYGRENIRFWTAVVDDYAFSDVTVEVPKATRESTLYVKVNGSGYGNWGLSFGAYLDRSNSEIGCYLTRRKETHPAVEIYEDVNRSLDELRRELGDDLEFWDRGGRPRIGFRRRTKLPFAPDEITTGEFPDAVSWMRGRLDRLVSTLHPRLQRMISARN